MARHRGGELPPKQLRFVEEYLIDLNATHAYKRAGFTCKNDDVARVEGCKLLAKPSIAKVIRRAINERTTRSKVKQDRVVQELACVALLDPADILDFTGDAPVMLPASDIPEYARRAIASIKIRQVLDKTARGGFEEARVTEIKFCDKNSALDKLMRHLGAYELDNEQAKPAAPASHPLDGLDLAPDIRKALLEAWRKKKAAEGKTK